MNETCANGCIPSSPRVGCPVHGPKAKPPEPEDLPHPGTGRLLSASPVKPPEPAPDERWLPNEAVRELVTGLRAQLAAAQARVKELEEDVAALGFEEAAATERAERAERERAVWQTRAEQWEGGWEMGSKLASEMQAERDAAIKAKEEAERAAEIGARDTERLHEAWDKADAERKRADELAASFKDAEEWVECYRDDWLKAEATAGELRAALEAVHPPHPQPEICSACALLGRALAAHSKAVGP